MEESAKSKSVVVTVPTLHVDMAPHQFQRFAEKYLEVAHLIPNSSDGFTPVPYYLVCRSLELAFKAYCLVKGDKQSAFMGKKGIGHSLLKAVERANFHRIEDLIEISALEIAELTKADRIYADKGFEYHTITLLRELVTGCKGLPNLTVLKGLADRLVPSLKQMCIEAG